jgi:hypothetical protein
MRIDQAKAAVGAALGIFTGVVFESIERVKDETEFWTGTVRVPGGRRYDFTVDCDSGATGVEPSV